MNTYPHFKPTNNVEDLIVDIPERFNASCVKLSIYIPESGPLYYCQHLATFIQECPKDCLKGKQQ